MFFYYLIYYLAKFDKPIIYTIKDKFIKFLSDDIWKGKFKEDLQNKEIWYIVDIKQHNKEIWILFQDISKAYDHVNIFMIRHTLNRLKLPNSFINFITNLFMNRSNQIFTPFSLTDKYDVLVGIDQEKVICPIFWCIYYDPLLSYIQWQPSLSYHLAHQ